MFSAIQALGLINTFTVQPVVAAERAVFYREKAAGMYSAFPYAFGQVQTLNFPAFITKYFFFEQITKYTLTSAPANKHFNITYIGA